MNRYQDNISPEPNIGLNLNECYKTPNLQQFPNMYSIGQLYPTPPSDSDSSIALENNCKMSGDNFSTPTLSYYDQKNFKNEHQDGSAYRNLQKEDKNNQPTVESKPSSRFKRRSRTTYTKTQLDVLESTFQKTHYPEIRVVDDLSSMLNLSTERISIWFQNRRARFKKARKLETQENRMSMENINQVLSNSYNYSNGYPTFGNMLAPKQEDFSRNLFNSFAPVQEDQTFRHPFVNQLNKPNFYGEVSGIQQTLNSTLNFYPSHLNPET